MKISETCLCYICKFGSCRKLWRTELRLTKDVFVPQKNSTFPLKTWSSIAFLAVYLFISLSTEFLSKYEKSLKNFAKNAVWYWRFGDSYNSLQLVKLDDWITYCVDYLHTDILEFFRTFKKKSFKVFGPSFSFDSKISLLTRIIASWIWLYPKGKI